MTKFHIAEVCDNVLTFEDGSRIVCGHRQDCCEYNYADFEQLDDLARAYAFDLDHLHFGRAPGGFCFGDDVRRMFFVPCYSDQNGYYTTDINVDYETLCRGYRMSTRVLNAIKCQFSDCDGYDDYEESDLYDDEREEYDEYDKYTEYEAKYERRGNYGNVIPFRMSID